MSHRHRTLAAVVALLLLASALRFHRLGAQSFWNDEGNSARLSERSIAAIVEGTASDVHPPLYYILLRGWRELAGETEFGLRALSAFAGVLTVAVVVAVGKCSVSSKQYSVSSIQYSVGQYSVGQSMRRSDPLNTDPLTTDPLTTDPLNTAYCLLLTTLLTAVSPVLVYYSQETRMYALLALLAAAGTWALLLWLGGAGRRWAVAYVLLAAAGLYTHYFFPAVMVAQGLIVLLNGPKSVFSKQYSVSSQEPVGQRPAGSNQRPLTTSHRPLNTEHWILNTVHWAALAGTAFALYLPWLPIFLRQVGGRGGSRMPLTDFLVEVWRWLVLGSTVGRGEAVWALVAAAVLAVLGLLVALRQPTRHPSASEGADSADATRHTPHATRHPSASEDADSTLATRHSPHATRHPSASEDADSALAAFPPAPLLPRSPALPLPARSPALPLAAFVAVPPVLMYLVGATDPAFFKFLLAAVPFLCLLMGLAWAAPRRWLWLPGVLTALVLAGSAVSLGNLYSDPAFARADYRSMAARIAADGRNVGVLLVAPNQWEVFTYYHRDDAPVYPLPLGQPDPALVEPALAAIAAAHERLYVLYWGEGQRDPEGVIERWLDANTFKASEEWVGDVRFVVYAVAPAADAPLTPSGAAFAALDGETITLQEFAAWPTVARPGDVVGVRLVWSADVTPARPYKVFLHLLAADGQLVAQRDGEPGGGSRPTTSWAAGETVIDNHGLLLPADLPPGQYELRLGLYDALDPAVRLPVDGGDSLPLGVITVEKEERNAE